MFQVMSGLSVLIYAIIVLALFLAFMWSAGKEDRETWRHCLKCGRWFNECGKVVSWYPLGGNYHPPGVCPDCRNDLDFNRE